MKPYALCIVMIYQRVLNYHFSSAQRIAENAFGIFYFFDAAFSREKIVLTSCVLHNFLRDKSLSLYALPRILCKKHCMKYQKFTQFSGMKILRKGAFPHFYTRILGKISVFYAGESANDNLIEEDWRTERNDFFQIDFKTVRKQFSNGYKVGTRQFLRVF